MYESQRTGAVMLQEYGSRLIQLCPVRPGCRPGSFAWRCSHWEAEKGADSENTAAQEQAPAPTPLNTVIHEAHGMKRACCPRDSVALWRAII